MDKTHVALYCDTGIKVFSKDPKDVRPLSDYVNPREGDKTNTFELQLKPAAFPGKSLDKGGLGFLGQPSGGFGQAQGGFGQPPGGFGSGYGGGTFGTNTFGTTNNTYLPPAGEGTTSNFGMFGSTTSSSGGLFGNQSLFGGQNNNAQLGHTFMKGKIFFREL